MGKTLRKGNGQFNGSVGEGGKNTPVTPPTVPASMSGDAGGSPMPLLDPVAQFKAGELSRIELQAATLESDYDAFVKEWEDSEDGLDSCEFQDARSEYLTPCGGARRFYENGRTRLELMTGVGGPNVFEIIDDSGYSSDGTVTVRSHGPGFNSEVEGFAPGYADAQREEHRYLGYSCRKCFADLGGDGEHMEPATGVDGLCDDCYSDTLQTEMEQAEGSLVCRECGEGPYGADDSLEPDGYCAYCRADETSAF